MGHKKAIKKLFVFVILILTSLGLFYAENVYALTATGVSRSYKIENGTLTRTWHATMTYTAVSSSATTSSCTVSAVTTVAETTGTWNNAYFKMALTATDKGTIASRAKTGYTMTNKASHNMLASTQTISYTRGCSAASKTVTGTITHVESSLASAPKYTFTVPALARYTITYNANGGSGAPATNAGTNGCSTSDGKVYGKTFTLSSTRPTRSGYTFTGWNTNAAGTGTNYAAGGTYTGNAALALYAKWEMNSLVFPDQTKTVMIDRSNKTLVNNSGTGYTWNSNTSTGYNAGNYTVEAILDNGYIWNDYTTGPATISCPINKKSMDITSANYSHAYDGDRHSIIISMYEPVRNYQIYYSTTTELTSSNYSTAGTTTKPTFLNTNAGPQTVYWYVHSTNGNYIDKSGSNTVIITGAPLEAPQNINVSTGGIVTWDSVTGATGYQISLDGTNWTTATNGMSYLTAIENANDITEIYVRATSTNTTYCTSPSEPGVAELTAHLVSFESNRTESGTVDVDEYKVIDGATMAVNNNVITIRGVTTGGTTTVLKTITATAEADNVFIGWSEASGTITEDLTVEAIFGATATITVLDGTISGVSTKTVAVNTNPTFNVVPSEPTYEGYVSCTNDQTGLEESGVVTIQNITKNTACTVDFGPAHEDFTYKGYPEDYTIGKDGYYYIEMAGASGGNIATGQTGGSGAKTSGYVYLDEGDTLYFYVGGQGTTGATATIATYAGGYNGGGNGYVSRTTCSQTAASGGGATDVRLATGNWDSTSSLISRLMVAGGGGGAYGENCSTSDSAYVYGGEADGLYGFTPTYQSYVGYSSLNPVGGTQTSGGQGLDAWTSTSYSNNYTGSFGKGGTGGNSYSGGGGGYYGGASGVWQPGAGGSSYISGYAGSNSVEENTTITHTYQTKHYSGKYFIGAEIIASQNVGNGYASIKYVGQKPAKKNTKLDNVRYIKDCTNYNTANNGNHWVELQAIKDGVNLAKGKTVTGTTTQSSDRPYTRIVDGDMNTSNWSAPSSQANNQCVTIDLGSTYDLDEVALWNFFGDQRRYYSNNITVSSDNSTWRSISETSTEKEVWLETSNGARWNAYINHMNGYVTSPGNMMLWYDGYYNNGGVRAPSVTTWKNLASTSLSGTVLNGTAAGASWSNYYLTLDGTNDWVRIAAMNYAKPTIEVVFMPTKVYTAQAYIAGNVNAGGYGLTIENGNIIKSYYYVSSAYHTSGESDAIPANSMAQFATSYDQTDMKLYQNGELIASNNEAPGTIGAPTNSTVMAIGANPNGTSTDAGYFFQGRIYSVRIYNNDLTDEQIYRNYLYDKQRFRLP